LHGETRDSRDAIDGEVDGGRAAVFVANHLAHGSLGHVARGAEEDAEILIGPVIARANHQQGTSVREGRVVLDEGLGRDIGHRQSRDLGGGNQRENAALLANGEGSDIRRWFLQHAHGRGTTCVRFQFEHEGRSVISDGEGVEHDSTPSGLGSRSSNALALQRCARQNEHALSTGLGLIDDVQRPIRVPAYA
jgi:hypothetical protein